MTIHLGCQTFLMSEFQLETPVLFSPLIQLSLVDQDHQRKRQKFKENLHAVNILLQKVHQLAQWVC